MYPMSGVTCHLSPVTCYLLPVTCHLSPTLTATYPPPANSPDMHSRLVHQDRTKKPKTSFKYQKWLKPSKKSCCLSCIIITTLFDKNFPALLVLVPNREDTTHPRNLQLID